MQLPPPICNSCIRFVPSAWGWRAIALSPNGQLLAVGTSAGWGLYALTTLHQVRFTILAGGVSGLVWRNDGHQLAVVSDSQGIIIYHVPDAVVVGTMQGEAPLFSPDSTTITSLLPFPPRSLAASTGNPRPVAMLLSRSTAHASADTDTGIGTDDIVRFSPNDRLIAAVLYGHTLLWNRSDSPENRKPLARVLGVQPLFSPDGQMLATMIVPYTDAAMEVRLWSVPTGQLLSTLVLGPTFGYMPLMAFRQDSAAVYVVGDQQLQTWKIAGSTLERTSHVIGTQAIFSPLGRVVVTSTKDDERRIYGIQFTRLADERVLYQDEQARFGDEGNDANHVTFSSNSATAAYLTRDGHVRVLNLVRGSTRDLVLPRYSGPTFSPDGQTIAAVQGTEAVALWRINDPAFAQQLTLPQTITNEETLDRIEFAPDGRSLVAEQLRYPEQRMIMTTFGWDLAHGETRHTVWSQTVSNADQSYGMHTYSLAAHTVAWWATDQSMQLQRDGDARVSRVPEVVNGVQAMAFSRDGRLLAIGSSLGSMRLFRVEPSAVTLTQTLSIESRPMRLVYSRDSTLLGAIEESVFGRFGVIWQVGQAMPLLHFGVTVNKAPNPVQGFVITPDNQLVIAARANDVTAYRISDGKVMATLPISSENIAISPAGDWLAINSDGRLLLWKIGS